MQKMMVGPQRARLEKKIEKLEADTGFRVRVLTQVRIEKRQS